MTVMVIVGLSGLETVATEANVPTRASSSIAFARLAATLAARFGYVSMVILTTTVSGEVQLS